MKHATTRRMKVYDKRVVRGEALYYGRHHVTFPEIRLMGRWLQDCGFLPGQQIEVSTQAGKLIITISKEC